MNYSYDLSGNVTVRTIGVVAPQITGQPVQQVAAPGDIVTFSAHPRLIVYSGAGGSVTVTPMKLSYDLGESVILTPHAHPAGWYRQMGWRLEWQ